MESTDDSHVSQMSRLSCLHRVQDWFRSTVSTRCTVHISMLEIKSPHIYDQRIVGNILGISMNILSFSYENNL